MTFWRQGRRTPAWWLAAALVAALVAADVYGQVDRGVVGSKAVFFFATMSTWLVAALWVWAWRPLTRMGPLMYWWPALWVAGDLVVSYPASRLAATIGLALFDMGPIVMTQMASPSPATTGS